MAHYHEALCRRGVGGYTLEQLAWIPGRDIFGGLLMAIVASMVVQRTERGDLMFLTSTTRHAQHALDADALAARRRSMTSLLVLCTGNAARR